MEYMNCNLCGGNDTKLLFKTKDRNWLTEGSFSLVRCKGCGLVYLSPRPEHQEIAKYYPSHYFSKAYGTVKLTAAYQSMMERSFEYRLKQIIKYKKGGRILDIGCGEGYFLKFLSERNWQTYGLELSEIAAKYAREVLGMNVFIGQLKEASYPDRFFDVITLYDVFEHLYNPSRLPLEIRYILKEDGILLISVPNFDSLERIIFNERWHAIDAPRHLFHFNERLLKLILKKNGFRILRLYTTSTREGERTWGYTESLRYLLMDYHLYPPKKVANSEGFPIISTHKNIWKRILHSLEICFFYPFSILADILGMGATLIAVAKKN